MNSELYVDKHKTMAKEGDDDIPECTDKYDPILPKQNQKYIVLKSENTINFIPVKATPREQKMFDIIRDQKEINRRYFFRNKQMEEEISSLKKDLLRMAGQIEQERKHVIHSFMELPKYIITNEKKQHCDECKKVFFWEYAYNVTPLKKDALFCLRCFKKNENLILQERKSFVNNAIQESQEVCALSKKYLMSIINKK